MYSIDRRSAQTVQRRTGLQVLCTHAPSGVCSLQASPAATRTQSSGELCAETCSSGGRRGPGRKRRTGMGVWPRRALQEMQPDARANEAVAYWLRSSPPSPRTSCICNADEWPADSDDGPDPYRSRTAYEVLRPRVAAASPMYGFAIRAMKF